ncbi:MAG: UDP-N-acetylglucosamine pyrophosphorylase [Candidatus Magnetoglobus multicellularis str. Araruama]|uniref:UDP-N-acetylglucosamine pyrophosphorylase n=1 Tax=Candidatus Magnetoglobus multicellularis str. Araruama TaxID=890399 RepID=A0A1V1P4B4_9BACT|nr:MAG: UDP-N-acetylglucosamine pyrophosphorylase [Candidatus Magnetoglobus multicellularis str. Araruama]
MPDKIHHSTIEGLIQKGVKIPCPQSIEIGPEVNPDRISSENVTIHTGCKLYGEKTLILSGTTIGEEAPATIKNCHVGANVHLKGGFFDGAVFLDHAQMGSGAHVRKGTILEEYASGAHTVGLKQTILMPFVTLGSLINFCDCLMAGGTDKSNHSEVGSSYIHFNYTPNQDKATASLIGDVPNGVMLQQAPIFLGGQGGLVGPCRIAYGTVIVAGSVYRKDIVKQDQLVMDGAMRHASIGFTRGLYQNVNRIVDNNALYMANIVALSHWYYYVRKLWASDLLTSALQKGLCETIENVLEERTKQMKRLSEKMPASIQAFHSLSGAKSPVIDAKQCLYDNCTPFVEVFLDAMPPSSSDHLRDNFLEELASIKTSSYLDSIQSLDENTRTSGINWLQRIVNSTYNKAINIVRV